MGPTWTYLCHLLCGYWKGFNAQHALLSMLDKWKVSLHKGGYGGAVLMDLRWCCFDGHHGAVLMDIFKAFDTISHPLIAKLHAYGFDKDPLKVIKTDGKLTYHLAFGQNWIQVFPKDQFRATSL